MSTAVESFYDWGELLRLWQELDVPEGWCAELSYEGITMTPPPAYAHVKTANLVHKAFARALSDEYDIHQTLGVGVEQAGSIFVPDLCVTRRGEVSENPTAAECLLLAVEITSPGNAKQDRNRKRWGYAHGGVPLYLLVDRFDEDGPAVTLFSEPSEGHYRRAVRLPFGEPVALPGPFAFELDTTGY